MTRNAFLAALGLFAAAGVRLPVAPSASFALALTAPFEALPDAE